MANTVRNKFKKDYVPPNRSHLTFVTENDQWEGIASKLFTAPSSITLTTGDNLTGDVGDLADADEVNVVAFDEVTGVPGFDFRVTFTSIVRFNKVCLKWKYNGSATHYVLFQIYNKDTTNWDTFDSSVGTGDYYISSEVTIPNSASYIDSGTVILRLYHITSGNSSQDATVDTVCLVEE